MAQTSGYPGLTQGDPEWGPPRFIDPRQEFRRQDNLHHFLEVIRDGTPSLLTIAEAYYALKVTVAMRESALRKGTPVKVSDD